MERYIYNLELNNFTHNNSINIFVEKKVLKKPFPLHSHHDYIEIEYCCNGEGYQILNGEKVNISKGTFFLVSHSDTHEIFPIKPLSLITLSFNYMIIPASISQYFSLIHKENFYFEHVPQSKYIKTLFQRAQQEYTEQDLYSFSNLENILSLILIEILRLKKKNISSPTTNKNLLINAINYINMHFIDNPSLEEVAKFVYLTPSYFCSFFKKGIGQSFKNYIRELKVKQAKKLLKNGLSVTDSCYMSGFPSLNDFSRTFKKIVGITPSEYKKNKQE